MKQVEEEYYKADEKPVHVANGSNHAPAMTGSQELYPPSPDQPLITMTTNMPDPVKDAVNSLIKSSQTVSSLTEPFHKDKEENVIVIPVQDSMIPLESIAADQIAKPAE